MPNKPLTVYDYHFIGICSKCQEQKFLHKIIDCVTAFCKPCWLEELKKVKKAGVTKSVGFLVAPDESPICGKKGC